jgi:enabled protein
MEIPDLSLRSTFSPPYYKDQASTSSCMCKYTIYNLECGHPAEDHVDTKDCPHFQKTGVPCDRENPANRGRVSIKSEDRSGLCKSCQRRQRDKAELDAMTRDEERAKQQSIAEAKEREAAAKAHEERLYKESAEEYERQRRKREQEDIEYMLQKSREEAAIRERKERDDLARALEESCRLGPADRNVKVDTKVCYLND